jgi:hypothetical protein
VSISAPVAQTAIRVGDNKVVLSFFLTQDRPMLADIIATGRQVTQKQANAVLHKQADLTPDQWNALYGAGIGAGVGGVGYVGWGKGLIDGNETTATSVSEVNLIWNN